MKITNKSRKIIGIAGIRLLPHESASISDADANTEMVQHFVSLGMVSLTKEAVKAPEPEAGKKTTGKAKTK